MRTITVKGVGTLSAKPDLTVIKMDLKSKDKDYEKCMELSSLYMQGLCSALEKIGFEKSDLKTVSFDVEPSYDNVKDRGGNYKRVFEGYNCTHRLKLEFDFNVALLAKVLATIASCPSYPELSIEFTVKDPSAVKAELLKSATENAKQKALILSEAAGVKLGDLLSIDYNWSELNVYSRTSFRMEEDRCVGIGDMNFEPDDINLRDTVTFVWEII